MCPLTAGWPTKPVTTARSPLGSSDRIAQRAARGRGA